MPTTVAFLFPKICFDQNNGCLRPYWEIGPQHQILQNTTQFSESEGTTVAEEPILIHCHVFYVELLPELVKGWKCIEPRKILISTDSAHKAKAIERLLVDHGEKNYTLRICANRGRDIGPLLTALVDEVSGDNILIHCHTKKTPQAEGEFGNQWREFLIKCTFPQNTKIFGHIVKLIQKPESGIILPWPHRLYAHNVNWGENFAAARKLGRVLKHDIKRYHLLYFPAGSFFWTRVSCLRPLFELNLRSQDFCEEPTPGDGRLAHVLERYLGLIPFLQQKDNYAIWLGGEQHAMPECEKEPQVVKLPHWEQTRHYEKTWFQEGLRKALQVDSSAGRPIEIDAF